MGYDRSVQIGPYLEVKGKIEKNVAKVKRVCPNHKSRQTKDKFCSLCGTLVENVDFNEVETITPKQLLRSESENSDDLYSPEGMSVFISNLNPPNNISVDYYDYDSIDLSDKAEVMSIQLDWFKSKFSEEIKLFVDNFGKENVKVCWGVLVYWS